MARSSSAGSAQSKPEPRGIQVKAPPPRVYLCSHICRCGNSTVLVDSKGRRLRQRCVSKGVDNDYRANVQNVYLGEVGYDMTKTPPAPLMSKEEPGRPSRFPLGAATREGLLNLPKEVLEASGGSTFRIPDVIKVVTPGQPPVQGNIDRVIEIKFKGDKFGEPQQKAYIKIAGNPKKLMLIKESDCNCQRKRQEEPVRETTRQPMVVPQPAPAVRRQYYPAPEVDAPGLPPPSGRPLEDYLIAGAEVVGGVVLVAGIIYFAPLFGTALAGSLMINRFANAKEK